MHVIKTTAIVESPDQLKLKESLFDVKSGDEIQIMILPKNDKKNWQKILGEIGTYNEPELKDFQIARKDINTWQPKEF